MQWSWLSLCHTSYLQLFFQGYHGDTSKTFVCGNVSPAMKRLIKVPFPLTCCS